MFLRGYGKRPVTWHELKNYRLIPPRDTASKRTVILAGMSVTKRRNTTNKFIFKLQYLCLKLCSEC